MDKYGVVKCGQNQVIGHDHTSKCGHNWSNTVKAKLALIPTWKVILIVDTNGVVSTEKNNCWDNSLFIDTYILYVDKFGVAKCGISYILKSIIYLMWTIVE